MRETPFFFEHAAARLFAVHHEPADGGRMLPFLFCHPFGEEKLWAHRVYVSFARELARRGHPVLRMDFMGNGDSSGAFTESSVSTALADVAAGVDLLRGRTGAERIGLLGLRFGAAIAYTTAAMRPDIDALVLWAPIVDGQRYLQELLRINLTTQMAVYREIRQDRDALTAVLAAGSAVNVDGYEIGAAMGTQLGALSLAGDGPVPAARALIVQIERSDKAQPSRELLALQARLPLADLRLAQEEPFWKEILRFYDSAPHLFATTLDWLAHQ